MNYSTPTERKQVFTELATDMFYGILDDQTLHSKLDSELTEATRKRRAENLAYCFAKLNEAVAYLRTANDNEMPGPVYLAIHSTVIECATRFAQELNNNRDVISLAFTTPQPAPAAQPAPASPRKR